MREMFTRIPNNVIGSKNAPVWERVRVVTVSVGTVALGSSRTVACMVRKSAVLCGTELFSASVSLPFSPFVSALLSQRELQQPLITQDQRRGSSPPYRPVQHLPTSREMPRLHATRTPSWLVPFYLSVQLWQKTDAEKASLIHLCTWTP